MADFIKCSACGTQITSDKNSCPICGASLQSPTITQQQTQSNFLNRPTNNPSDSGSKVNKISILSFVFALLSFMALIPIMLIFDDSEMYGINFTTNSLKVIKVVIMIANIFATSGFTLSIVGLSISSIKPRVAKMGIPGLIISMVSLVTYIGIQISYSKYFMFLF